ncbi:hypothetical protein [Desulfovibrio sp. JC010]|uniref:hypothetical protein n=1 Tax=Desulfovibrio sp. JC010 TaxID=2593641 RepID=UPI0013CFACD5|nr:hypothetical protein [Desulfovibrio sp. JC010]NDV28069.1 hypothetical protein [Desulfovibrio sp. JC010]
MSSNNRFETKTFSFDFVEDNFEKWSGLIHSPALDEFWDRISGFAEVAFEADGAAVAKSELIEDLARQIAAKLGAHKDGSYIGNDVVSEALKIVQAVESADRIGFYTALIQGVHGLTEKKGDALQNGDSKSVGMLLGAVLDVFTASVKESLLEKDIRQWLRDGQTLLPENLPVPERTRVVVYSGPAGDTLKDGSMGDSLFKCGLEVFHADVEKRLGPSAVPQLYFEDISFSLDAVCSDGVGGRGRFESMPDDEKKYYFVFPEVFVSQNHEESDED